ncbi:hypothetical protein C8R44DRAFT_919388 [Mycena epipterygia]|nr:hypothetical protein C8R44DRAFT_919388 [Mycena epipterygia]
MPCYAPPSDDRKGNQNFRASDLDTIVFAATSTLILPSTMSHSGPTVPESRPVLSAAVPFQEVLRSRTNTFPASGVHEGNIIPKSPTAAVLPNMQPLHEQKGLSKADSDGLERARLSTNSQSHFSRTSRRAHSPSRPSISRPQTHHKRAATLPENIIASTTPVTATGPSLSSLSQGTPVPMALRSTPRVSTMDHYGISAFVPTDPAKVLAMAKRSTKNLGVFADSSRATDSKVERLELDVDNLTIELRLRADTPWGERYGNGSPEGVKRALTDGRTSEDENLARIAALERSVPEVVPNIVTVAELRTAVALRFTEITSDPNVLDADIKYHAVKQEK